MKELVMSENKLIKPLPNSLLFAIITHIFIGIGYLGLTDLAGLHLRHNTYLSLLLALPFVFPVIWIISDLMSFFPGRPVAEVIKAAFGKYLGMLINLIYILIQCSLMIFVLRESQLMVGSYFLEPLDVRILIIGIAGLTLYLAGRGIAAIGRLAAFMLIIPLAIMYGLNLLSLTNVNTLNLRPIFEGAGRLWLEAGVDLLFMLLPASIAFAYLPFFKSSQNLLRVTLIALGLSIPLFFLILFGTTGVFGPAMIGKFTWPAVEFFHILDLSFLLVEKAGLIFVITWYVFIFTLVAQSHFILGHLVHTAFPVIKANRAIMIMAVITTIIAVILPFNAVAMKSLLLSASRYIVGINYGIILLTWIIVRLRYRKQR
jgi:spore germination protein AB